MVYVFMDEETERLAGSSKLNRYIGKGTHSLQRGDKVELVVTQRTDLGYVAAIDYTQWGVLFHSELFRPLRIGQKISGYIKRVRDDGKIDLSLQKIGYDKVDDLSKKIINVLRAEGGFLALSDKSPASAIYEKFGVSKNAFKMTIGTLYKQRKIVIKREGISLVS